MKKRLETILPSVGEIARGYLRIINRELEGQAGIPSLLTAGGQAMIEDRLEGAELLVLDNVVTLFRGGKENDADTWGIAQEFVLRLRSQHVSTLLVHHAGRNGEPRGTSAREDVLDVSLRLIHPEDYRFEEGARFTVEFGKGRDAHGLEVAPLQLQMRTESGMAVWTADAAPSAPASMEEAAARLFREGHSVREVGRMLGVGTSTAGRYRQRWEGRNEAGH
jgi:putative DNA primase/helicase